LIASLIALGCHKAVRNPEVGTSSSTSSPLLPQRVPLEPEAAKAELENYVLKCSGELVDLTVPIKEIADSIQALQIMYGNHGLRDCSGIFHRVVQSLKARCPEVELPAMQTARSSRAIARWYAERGEFVAIVDPLQQADLIKPGAVMFYGGRNCCRQNLDVERALREIKHIGVVVSVERKKDERGEIVRYELFHGRSRGKVAAITKHHHRKPYRPSLPPFGNGDQPWIGFARVCKVASR
jgi:hypothetical protein